MSITSCKYESDIFLRVVDSAGGAIITQGSGNFGVEALHIPSRIIVTYSNSSNVHTNRRGALAELGRLLKAMEAASDGANESG